MRPKKKNTQLRTGTVYAFYFFLLYLLIFLVFYLNYRDIGLSALLALFLIIAAVIAYILSVFVHETGHLLFGLLTGYRPVSFRIFSFVIKKKNGRWRIGIEPAPMPGIAGQCLMAPPRKVNGQFPYRLCNAGGVLLGFIVSAAALILLYTLSPSYIPRLLLFYIGWLGLFFSLVNAVPTSGKRLSNDGTNGRAAKRSIAARNALWNQLEYMALLAEGTRTRDMPEELFFLPEERDLDSALTVCEGMMYIDRLEDTGDYAGARDAANHLLKARVLLPLYRACLLSELLFLELVLDARPEEIDRLHREVEASLPLLKHHASTYRTLYAFALLSSEDESAAAEALARFESLAARNPAGTLPDRDMIAHVQTLYQNRKEG